MPRTLGPDQDFISLVEVKHQLNMEGTTRDDAELALVKDAAMGVVEGLVGAVRHEAHVEVHRPSSAGYITLRRRPVLAVTSVQAAGVDIAYEVDLADGLLRDVKYRGDVTVAYTAGRTVVPAEVALATLIVAQHLWRTQQGTGPTNYDDDVEGPYATNATGFAIPSRAEELLRPYALGPVFA